MLTLIRHAIEMRRTQSVATLLSVALSVAVVLALALASMGVRAGIEASRSRLGADLMVIPADAAVGLDQNQLLFTSAPANMYMDASVERRVRGIAGVERVTAQFFGQTLNASCCSASSPARLVGYDASTDWVIAPWTSKALGSALGPSQIVAGSRVAPDYVSGGMVLGRPVELAAALDESGTDLDGSILMDMDQVRSFVRGTPELAHLWQEHGDPDGLVSCVLVDVADGQRDAVVSELSRIEGVSVVETSDAMEKVSGQMSSLFSIMAGAAALLVAATLFQLFARFFSLAWDRRTELALYRALGASRREVSRLIGGEAAVLVGVGTLVGLVVGGIAYLAVPGMLASAGSFPYRAPGPLALVATALAVAALFATIGLAAVAWPLSRAGRIDPSSAMQTGDID